VDLITQAALGAAMGELMLGKRLGNRALAWGALLGVLPDVDVVLSLPFDTAHQLAFRRGPTHSLWMIGLASYGLALWLAKRWVKEKITKLQAGAFVFAILAAHVLTECFTAEGASVLWPFSSSRVSFNHLFHTDFILSAPLWIMVIWLALLPNTIEKKSRSKKPAPPSKRNRVRLWGFGISATYLALSIGMKFIASAGFDADLKRRNITLLRRMEAPTPYNIFLWRAVVDRGDEFWVGYRSVFELHETPVRWTVYPQEKPALTGVSETREIKTLTRMTGGWWIARPHAKGVWLGDLRHGESRTWGDKKGMVDSRLAHSWVLDTEKKSDRLRFIDASNRGSHDSMQRLFARLMGNRESWEANPRLADVPGALPEFLPAYD
jgi:inner membrane protein